MITILLVGLIAGVSAAPSRIARHPQQPPFDGSFETYLRQELYDAILNIPPSYYVFCEMEIERSETPQRCYNIDGVTETIEGDMHKIIIPVPGFHKYDFFMKTTEGQLFIQAFSHGDTRRFVFTRMLPQSVAVQATWSYENDVLNVFYPVEQNEGDYSKMYTYQ
ncbi:uncharacterized protein LOC112048377 [Bicyclus anynana]|uniref:Uncharacterized protein LOC112048377 n=1 Tax=Bicyclus anynana TaxID=110368 RepID=A0A6J1N1C8_BICAN|nr:uncharacterized protein LOC112048377 [Bicyclus anynana]